MPRRRVSYGAIDPAAAREVFLREALVTGELATKGAFLAHNRQLIASIAELEHKARRQDVLVDDEALYAFYAERVPAGIHSTVAFERWRELAEATAPRLLYMTREALMRHAAASVTEEQYPETMAMAGAPLPLAYRFAPGHPLDGLTLTVPLALLNQIDAARLSWLVPGMIREKLSWYLKALPKGWRNRLTPPAEVVTAFLESIEGDSAAAGAELPDALRAFLSARLGEALPPDIWDGAELPPHLRVNVRIVDAAGKELAQSRDLAELRTQLGEAAQLSFAAAGPEFERTGIRSWDFGDLPDTLTVERAGRRLTGYPALVVDGDSAALRLLRHARSRGSCHAHRRCAPDPPAVEGCAAALGEESAGIRCRGPAAQDGDSHRCAACRRARCGQRPGVHRRGSAAALGARVRRPGEACSHAAAGGRREARSGCWPRSPPITTCCRSVWRRCRRRKHAWAPTCGRNAPRWSIRDFFRPRRGPSSATCRAICRRWTRDSSKPRPTRPGTQNMRKRSPRSGTATGREAEANRTAQRVEPALEAFRWLVEELKVSLFAQELRTPFPVSYKRLEKAWAELIRR